MLLMYVSRDARCGPPEDVVILSATSVSYPGVYGSNPKKRICELWDGHLLYAHHPRLSYWVGIRPIKSRRMRWAGHVARLE
jgi:hypothetical protein